MFLEKNYGNNILVRPSLRMFFPAKAKVLATTVTKIISVKNASYILTGSSAGNNLDTESKLEKFCSCKSVIAILKCDLSSSTLLWHCYFFNVTQNLHWVKLLTHKSAKYKKFEKKFKFHFVRY